MTIEFKDTPLPARAFHKDACVEQGAIDDSKVLGANQRVATFVAQHDLQRGSEGK
jgi:hypothetical protein